MSASVLTDQHLEAPTGADNWTTSAADLLPLPCCSLSRSTIYNQRWLGVRLDFLGTILTFVVAIIAVAESTRLNPSQIGLVLSYILAVQMSFVSGRWASGKRCRTKHLRRPFADRSVP